MLRWAVAQSLLPDAVWPEELSSGNYLSAPPGTFHKVCDRLYPSWRWDRHRIVFSPRWGLLYWWDGIFVIIFIMWFYWWCEESFVSNSKSMGFYDDAMLIFQTVILFPYNDAMYFIILLCWIYTLFIHTSLTYVICIHWKRNVILTKFSSQAALNVVKMTTFGAASDENVTKMTTFSFQYVSHAHKFLSQRCVQLHVYAWYEES